MKLDCGIVRVAAAMLGTAAWSAPSGAADTLEQAVRESDFLFDLRARYEGVGQDGMVEDAEALTSRLRVGFQTAPLKKTSLLVEGVWIEDLVDDYNSTTNGQAQFPVLPIRPTSPRSIASRSINKSLENATLTFGRQRIVLDDQRFVGNVGWRQNEQTFDAVRAQLGTRQAQGGFELTSIRSTACSAPIRPSGVGTATSCSRTFRRVLPVGTLTFFDYFIDLDDADHAVEQYARCPAHGIEEARHDRRHVHACRTRTKRTPAATP